MGPAVLANPLLPDKPAGARKCRPQPLCHPRLETYPESLLKELSTYCYTCESRAVGAEALLHLYFGELACNHCFHNIKSCSDFRTRYPMAGLCKGSWGKHNACRWMAPTCKYVMYNTRKTLSMARCINNKFEKQEVFREATAYLRALLPLRGLYPWRSALKTIAKAGIAVDLSNCPPRLYPLETGRAVGKVMLGVSGLLNLEKSIMRLEKREKLKDGSERMPHTPSSPRNNSTHANTESTHSSTNHSFSVNSTESSPVPVETLQKSPKTKQKSKISTERNILISMENSSNTQTNQHKLHRKGTSRNTDTTTENTLPNTQTAPPRTDNPPVSTDNPPVSIETPHELHKKDVVKKNSVCVQPQKHLTEMPKPSSKASITSQSTRPDLERRKRKKTRVEDASSESHQEEREEAELKDMFASVANAAVMPQGTLSPRAKKKKKKKKLEVPSTTTSNTATTDQDIFPPRSKKKKKFEVPSTTTGNTATTDQDILPPSTEEREKPQPRHTSADMEIIAGTTQDTLPVTAENAIKEKHKKKIKNSLKVGNKRASAEDVLPDDGFFVCVESTASRKQRKRKAESVGGSEPPSATGDGTLPPSGNIAPKTHKKKKRKNSPEVESEATSAQDVSLDNAQLGSEQSASSKKHKRRKLKHSNNVKHEVIGVPDPIPITSLPSSIENTPSKKHKRRKLKSCDDDGTDSEAAPKQRKRKLKNSADDLGREPPGEYSAILDTLDGSGCVEDGPSRGAEAENSPSRRCRSTSQSTPAATEDIRANTQDSLPDKLRHPSDKSTLRKAKRKQQSSSAASQGNSCEAPQPPFDAQRLYNILPELLNIVSPQETTLKRTRNKSSSATARDISS